MRIDIVSDTVCPWCFVGKRRMERAMEQRPDLEFDVHWHPFQLNENVPLEGVDRKTFYREKFGGDERVRAITRQLCEIGATLDIQFDFDGVKVQPNTRLSHCLIDLAEGPKQSDVKEAVLSAFFEQGLDIGDPEVLTRLGAAAGLEPDLVRAQLNDPQRGARIEERARAARSMGISGVPTFILNRSQGFSGAQEEQLFLDLFDELSGR